MSNVRCFKMINGEELMADVVGEIEGSAWLVKSPVSLIMQEMSSGNMGMGMAPCMTYCFGDITINFAAIAFEGAPDPKLLNEYNKHFGSGIVVAPANVLLKG